jgi:hypothetical protein
MNVLTTRVVLRERTLAEVFDLAFRFVAVRGGRKYLRLWLLWCGPLLLMCIESRRLGLDWVWVWALACAGFVFGQIPFTLAASRLLLAEDLPLRDIWVQSRKAILGQLFMHALAFAAIALCSLLLVPVPFLAARFLYLPEISLLEGSGLVRAYERGTRITKHRLGHALETALLLLTVLAAFVLGAEVTGQAVQTDLLSFPPPVDVLGDGGSWFALVGFFAAVPFLATARFLAYIDGRTRREAWDVQLRFTELAKPQQRAAA